MMSNANREIRWLEQEAELRRQRTTVRDLVHQLDKVIAELEELNMAGDRAVPDWLTSDFTEVESAIPLTPSTSDADLTTVGGLMERCFRLQEQLLVRRQLAS
jgi:hypothetical protein